MTPNKKKFASGRGRSRAPGRYVLYGPGSVGKTTLAASAPSPYFVCIEDGAREFDVGYALFDAATKRRTPCCYEEVSDVLDWIASGVDGGPTSLVIDGERIQTLVLDGTHQLDILVQDFVMRQNTRWKSIQEAGFGKGEAEVLNQWRPLVTKLEDINTRLGVRIVLLGHAQVINFKDPEGAEIGRTDLMVTKHTKGDVAGFLYGWADVFALARFELLTGIVGKGDRARTVAVAAEPERELLLSWTTAYQAKCRFGGPASMKMTRDGMPRPWSEIFGDLEDKAPNRLREAIEALLPQVDEETAAKAKAWLANVGDDVPALSKGLDNMKKKIESKEAA